MAYDVAENIELQKYISSTMKLPQDEYEQVIAELEEKVKKNVPTITLAPFSADIERHLNAGILVAQGKDDEEKHYIDFWILGLMQLGCAAKALRAEDNHAIENWLQKMSESIKRGYRQRDSENSKISGKKSEREQIKKEQVSQGREGGKAKNKKRYASSREYAEKRIKELIQLPSPDNRSSQMAITIAEELKEKCSSEIEGILVDSETIRKYWIPEFKKRQKEKCLPTP